MVSFAVKFSFCNSISTMSSPLSENPKWSSQFFGHPVFWLGITLIVVSVAYVWMDQTTDQVVYDPVKKLSREAAANKLKQAEAIIKQETMEITNSTDNDRADEYLEVETLENSVNPHFRNAVKNLERQQFVLPPNNNAWNDYQNILVVNPENNKAKSGLVKIRNLLIDNAETAIELGDFADAENWLVQLDVIQPGNPIQIDLRKDIKIQIDLEAEAKIRQQKEQEKLLKIENSLVQAAEAENSTPINYNKVKDLYNRILELDPENTRALMGLDRLVDQLLDQADQALRNQNLVLTKQFLAQAEDIDSENKRLGSIRLALESRIAQLPEIEQDDELGSSPEIVLDQQNSDDEIDAIIEDLVEEQTTLTEDSTDTTEIVETQPTISENDFTVVEETSAEQVLTEKNKKQLEEGIQAYYDGDYNKSFELLYPMAEEGISRAQFRIGVMYRYGRSVSQNSDLSEKWFTEALPKILRLAQQGEAWAQTDLGTSYELGISLKQDFERAAHWYRLAAEQGYPGAQTNLGVLYANGEGVNYSRSDAVFWLKKAAKKGDLVAIENLRIMGVTL